jgi:NADH:ubiquinone oxidoreductase subunit 3 (subunit A)
MRSEYLNSLIFFLIVFFLAIILIFVAIFFGGLARISKHKVSPYECGFLPYDDSRGNVEIQFYTVALLFVLFDVEIALLFPWVYALGRMDYWGIRSVLIFFFILSLGFIYEWKSNIFDWNTNAHK